jgi:hypothetical protein
VLTSPRLGPLLDRGLAAAVDRYARRRSAFRRSSTSSPRSAKVATVPAALGLWTTADDLVRFALGWSALLPAPLAEEAMRPLSRPSANSQVATGLGWHVDESRGLAGMSGMAYGAAASLVVKLDNGKVHIALTNRGMPIDEVNGCVLDALADS